MSKYAFIAVAIYGSAIFVFIHLKEEFTALSLQLWDLPIIQECVREHQIKSPFSNTGKPDHAYGDI